MNTLISLHSEKLQYIGVALRNPGTADIPEGVTAVIGPNGAGKTTLGRIVEKGWNITTNRISSPRGKLRTRFIEFSDIHSLTGFKAEYYQQRFESSMNDDIPTVGELLGEKISTDIWKNASERFGLVDIERKRLNYLSSGELRKLLIINLLFDLPDLLVIDNPYIGLDTSSRQLLDEMLEKIAGQGVSVWLLICDAADIPEFCTSVLPVKDRTLQPLMKVDRGNVKAVRATVARLFDFAVNIDAIPRTAAGKRCEEGEELFALNKCVVRYGGLVILPEITWRVLAGECWALEGPNGSGKSTLLSLIHADNPQGYSNDITLFGRRRGTGESIWDIKRRIGYVSPEMHLYFNGGATAVIDIVAQGLNDTVGNFKRLTLQQIEKGRRWLDLFHMEYLAPRRFNTLSAGEQRLVLLARTFIKNPELLILDEPLHGLDSSRKRAVRAVINALAARDRSALIYVTHYVDEMPECVGHTLTLPSRYKS